MSHPTATLGYVGEQPWRWSDRRERGSRGTSLLSVLPERFVLGGTGLSSQAKGNRTRESCSCHHQEMFKLDIRENVFTEKVVRHYNRQLREVMELPCL